MMIVLSRHSSSFVIALLLLFGPNVLPGSSRIVSSAAAPTPRASLAAASAIVLPGTVDSNSPLIWDLEDGLYKMFAMTSHSGRPSLAIGSSLDRLGANAEVSLLPHPGHGVWMEAVVSDEVETWYGFYHNEWPAEACGRPDRAVARIGAAKSTDRGRNWQDLGIVVQATQDTTACDSPNKYIIGGVGDLSVMLDADKQYLYLFYSQYQKQRDAQGVAVARLRWADRDRPAGRISIWRGGIWERNAGRREFIAVPGMMRRVEWSYPAATPLVATAQAWHDADARVDAFWGPAVHWNTFLEQYVMLLNRSRDESYTQEGVYVSFAPRLDDPSLWSAPQKLLNGGKWYPQVVGSSPGTGTDKLAGASARFFMSGRSDWLINFAR
jgi:hypothetical protein